MSGPLLLGIAAVGVGWAYIHRDVPGPPAPSVAPVVPTPPQLPDAVSSEVQQATGGTAAVVASLCCEMPSGTLGQVPVEGSDGGQVIPVNYVADGQPMVKADPNASLGGADPSTLTNGIHTGTDGYESPPFWKGDSQDVIMAARYGVAGADGMTSQQVGNAYRESAVWSNEVF